MADSDIPQHLIDLARRHADAVARTKVAARAGEPLDGPMAAERDAVAAIYAAREGTEWAAWPRWRKVVEAARGVSTE